MRSSSLIKHPRPTANVTRTGRGAVPSNTPAAASVQRGSQGPLPAATAAGGTSRRMTKSFGPEIPQLNIDPYAPQGINDMEDRPHEHEFQTQDHALPSTQRPPMAPYTPNTSHMNPNAFHMNPNMSQPTPMGTQMYPQMYSGQYYGGPLMGVSQQPLRSDVPAGPGLPAPRNNVYTDQTTATGGGAAAGPVLPGATDPGNPRVRATPSGLPARRPRIFQTTRDTRPVVFNDENCFCCGRTVTNLDARGAWLLLIASVILILLGIFMFIRGGTTFTILLPIFVGILGFLFPSPVFASLFNKKEHTIQETDESLQLRARAADLESGDRPVPSGPVINPSANPASDTVQRTV